MTNELGEISVGIVERQSPIDGIKLIEQQTQIFQAIMYLGLLFTIAVMLNTMIMNVAERDFELATLVLGASTKRLGSMLLFESLLIGIIGGIVFSILYSYWVSFASFSSWQFYVLL